MTNSQTLTERLVETLYLEAMVLADEAREHFTADHAQDDNNALLPPSNRVEMSCESLKVTTRLMHAIAWLLNQRAFFKGELSERQLRCSTRGLGKTTKSDPLVIARLDPQTRYLVYASEDLFSRISRMQEALFETGKADAPASPVQALQDQLNVKMSRV